MRNKNEICEVYISELRYPNIGSGEYNGAKVDVKNVVPGQTVEVSITRKKGCYIGRKLNVISKSSLEIDPLCPDFKNCGGCTYQNISYQDELKLKEQTVIKLFNDAGFKEINFLGIQGAENTEGYRNKMEFSFGDESKDGKLALGMRKRGSFYEVVTPYHCNIIDADYKKILLTVLKYFDKSGLRFHHRMTKQGVLRHLIIRKAYYTSEILVNLVTTSDFETDLNELAKLFLELELDGVITGFLHTTNDSVADAIYCDDLEIIAGRDYFNEKILGLDFRISPFSFFQTNSAGASQLYSYVIDLVKELQPEDVFDLYCGTGTIAQLVSKYAQSVIGVEIIPEAIEAATMNANQNKISNCCFIAGDVLKIIDDLSTSEQQPDLIILDPPRDGLHPKAAKKIIDFKSKSIIYISCKPTSLVRDLIIFTESGYKIESVKCFDLFPRTYHVETVVLMSRGDV